MFRELSRWLAVCVFLLSPKIMDYYEKKLRFTQKNSYPWQPRSSALGESALKLLTLWAPNTEISVFCNTTVERQWRRSPSNGVFVKGRFRPWSSDLLLFSITIRLHLTRRVLKFGQRFARKRFLMIKIYHIDVSRHLRANLTSCRQDEVLRSQTLQMVTISNVLFTTTNQSLCFCIWFTSQYEAHKQWLTQK